MLQLLIHQRKGNAVIITDEIRSFVNNLYSEGVRGNVNAYKGMSIEDERNLAALLLRASNQEDLPSIDDLDSHYSLHGMVSRHLSNPIDQRAQEIANHLGDLFINHFRPIIQQLMDDAYAHSPAGIREQEESAEQRKRDIESFDRQRM